MRSFLLTGALALFVFPAFAQMPLGQPQITPPNRQDNPRIPDETREKIDKDMAKRANAERQAELKRDTDNLLKMATELKQDVEKSNENMLSMNVIKKAEEIEKLARSVKEKMKGY